ncbi:MAG: NFACT RNA binding domain-containing protein [candidate division WOR-3 bacterium]
MRKIDFSSLNLKKFLNDEIVDLLPSRIEKVYFQKFLEERFLTFETEKFNLTFLCNKNFSFLMKDKVDGEKLKINFSEPLKNFCKGVKIKKVVQYGFERIMTLELSNGKKIIFNLIPSKFNIIITDESFKILNLYSFPKNKEGELVYKIGDEFKIEVQNDYLSYIDNRTKKFLSEKNLDIETILKMENYLLENKGKFTILPFVDEGFVVLKKSFLITDLVKEYLSYEEESLKKKAKDVILNQIEKEIENIKEKLSGNEEEKLNLLLNELNEKIETLKTNITNIKGTGIFEAASVFNQNKKIEIFIEKNPFYTLDKLYKKVKDVRNDLEKIELYKQNLLKKLNELEQKKENLDKIPLKIKKEKEEKRIGKIFYSPNGFMVICGRNSEENDIITLKIASKEDLFFHAREAKGAHVILKKGGKEPKKEDIYYAASIAAYNSKGKHSRIVPVSYTERRYVTKRKNSPKGEVVLLREEVIFVEPKER